MKKDGTEIKYRALVVAVGIDIKWDKIKGLPEALNQQCGVSSNYRFVPLHYCDNGGHRMHYFVK